MSTLIGDALLAGAFLTYCGAFDHRMRKELAAEWCDALDALGVPFQEGLDVVPFLSRPADQLEWRGCGLPPDELATQNAILLARFNRYPLIIDPSGQATAFILAKFAAQKIAQTSFLDAAFLKTLASAIRFGAPLLVHDVESIDPILNPVLNKELQKTGGRTLIRLGAEDIDFSPRFLIFLTTRNPSAHFAPDLCSRVTLVNFTVTPASLEAQALSAILKAERPDVDARRTEMLRLQSVQSVQLRALEDALLSKISAVQGAILDDDSVVNSLETIQSEAAQLSKEVAQTREMLSQVTGVSSSYEPLSKAMAAVYFSLAQLGDMDFLYQFSLPFFLGIVDRILGANAPLAGAATSAPAAVAARIRVLGDAFYGEVARRVLRSLRFDDQLLFVARLAQVATQGQAGKDLSAAEADFLLSGAAAAVTVGAAPDAALARYRITLDAWVLDDTEARQLLALTQLPAFAALPQQMAADAAAWAAFRTHPEPETALPLGWSAAAAAATARADVPVAPERLALLTVLLVRAFRPERTLDALEAYVRAVFGGPDRFPWRDHARADLKTILETDGCAGTPLMICSEAGQDASAKVDALAEQAERLLLSVAMGSAEGYADADRSIAQAAKSGAWVLLRNAHLCSADWLGALEKRLRTLTPHGEFRLFLTCDISPRLPAALLRLCEVVVAEASTGLKAGLQRFFGAIPPARADRQPAERCRLYGLLAWLNAVVHERLRYAPLGWTKRYEFNESDAACALDVIDQWVDDAAAQGKRAHVAPEELPWRALRTLLSQSLYGGRVDRPSDQAALDSFVDVVFRPDNYASGACLARDPSTGQVGLQCPFYHHLGRSAASPRVLLPRAYAHNMSSLAHVLSPGVGDPPGRPHTLRVRRVDPSPSRRPPAHVAGPAFAGREPPQGPGRAATARAPRRAAGVGRRGGRGAAE